MRKKKLLSLKSLFTPRLLFNGACGKAKLRDSLSLRVSCIASWGECTSEFYIVWFTLGIFVLFLFLLLWQIWIFKLHSMTGIIIRKSLIQNGIETGFKVLQWSLLKRTMKHFFLQFSWHKTVLYSALQSKWAICNRSYSIKARLNIQLFITCSLTQWRRLIEWKAGRTGTQGLQGKWWLLCKVVNLHWVINVSQLCETCSSKSCQCAPRQAPLSPTCSADTYYTVIYSPSENPGTTSKQFRYIPVRLTNDFLNIQKNLPIVMGAVLLKWNNSVLQIVLLGVSFVLH